MNERLRKEDWTVKSVHISQARPLVERLHYAKGASNTATYIHGLYWAYDENYLLGVAWWLPPTRAAAEATYPANWQGVLSLSRLVIDPRVPANACSFLISKSVRLICRTHWPCLVTYADDWRGHTGGIYRAANWQYCGKTKPQKCYTINGRMTAVKAGPKTRTHEQMLALGAVYEGKFAKHKFVHIC